MSHPMHGKSTGSIRGNAGLSRKDKIMHFLSKEGKRFTSHEIQEKLGFNTSHGIVIKTLNDMLKEELIKSENETHPTGIKTVYYVDIQSKTEL